MKKIIALVLCVIILVSVAACGKTNTDSPSNNSNTQSVEKTDSGNKDDNKTENKSFDDVKLNTIISANDYLLYQNIFFNKQADDHVNKEFVKDGTFTAIYDAFNKVTRYYVWGYYDNTKCCDWQWELKFDDLKDIPENGSLVTAKGKFVKDAKALDGYWMAGASVTVKDKYKGFDVDYDLTTMDSTLERVEVQNIQYKKEEFEGKTIALYGRVASANSIQHPYYDDSWNLEVVTNGKLPAIGTLVIVKGTIRGGGVINADFIKTKGF